MDIYNFMNEKMNRSLNGEDTKIYFPYKTEIRQYWINLKIRNSIEVK
jgi:hypothetical protein